MEPNFVHVFIRVLSRTLTNDRYGENKDPERVIEILVSFTSRTEMYPKAMLSGLDVPTV